MAQVGAEATLVQGGGMRQVQAAAHISPLWGLCVGDLGRQQDTVGGRSRKGESRVTGSSPSPTCTKSRALASSLWLVQGMVLVVCKDRSQRWASCGANLESKPDVPVLAVRAVGVGQVQQHTHSVGGPCCGGHCSCLGRGWLSGQLSSGFPDGEGVEVPTGMYLGRTETKLEFGV